MALPRVTRRAVAYPPPPPNTPEFHERRFSVVGASEVAALMLPNERRSWFSLFLAKTGQTVRSPEEPRSPQAGGRYFERSIADWYRDTSQGEVTDIAQSWVEHDEQVPQLSASPDFDAFASADAGDRSHIVEVKLRSGVPQGWGEEGSDDIPLDILVQVHAQLTVTALPYADVAAFLGGIGLRVYRIHSDADIQARIRELVHTFWTRHVEPRVEPPLSGVGVSDYVAQKFLRATSEVIREANADEQALLDQCARAREAYRIAEHARDHADALVQNAIAEHRGLEGAAGRALWFNVKGRRTISEASLRAALERFVRATSNGGLLDIPIESIIADATQHGEDYRSFRFTAAKE
jgi:predicted phage-related endonuclease